MGKKMSTDVAMPAFKEPAPKSRASFSIHKKHGKMMPSVKVGQTHSFSVKGKVTGLRSDEYGHSVDLDMDTLQHDTDGDQETNEVASPVNDTTVKQPRASLSQAMKAMHAKRRNSY